ncbi:hypothetical protein DK867_12770 [Ochrobactrum sp. POC9]|uniref:hypothetical protein n=1 Tax=Ochrobactrum sp. POC9 TaxID=2203419 RepID=UPI000D708511|nr:hypothetical protein [Ochrobactrum sp. POC9]PWU72743.1 hypothetical protein DK867_12770 [Ochrobactrum sp. POC9]
MNVEIEKPRVRAQAGSRRVAVNDDMPITEQTEYEVADLHSGLAAILSASGLTGHALDLATSETFRLAVRHIQNERIAMQRRTSSIHVVGQEVD